MSHLPLISTRSGKRVVQWPVVFARFAVYMLIFGSIVFAVSSVIAKPSPNPTPL